jgi:hypothetical protein
MFCERGIDGDGYQGEGLHYMFFGVMVVVFVTKE